jgi:hypothetical protein
LLGHPDRRDHLVERAALAAAHGRRCHGEEVALEVGLADLAHGARYRRRGGGGGAWLRGERRGEDEECGEERLQLR